MKQNLINVLHNKLVKKKCHPSLLSDSLIQKLCVLIENDLIIMGDLPLFEVQKLVYFNGQPAHTHSHCSIFSSNLSILKFKHFDYFHR